MDTVIVFFIKRQIGKSSFTGLSLWEAKAKTKLHDFWMTKPSNNAEHLQKDKTKQKETKVVPASWSTFTNDCLW